MMRRLLVLLLCAIFVEGLVSRAAAAATKDGLFKCLDSSKTISADKVNDNYCDCADGSDEPDTSACIMLLGEHLIGNGKAAPFKCAHSSFSQSIPTHWVNDGLCDCCDGSDETSGLISCPNTCAKAGKERAQNEKKELAMLTAARRVKADMVKKAHKSMKEMEKEIPKLEKEVNSLTYQLAGQARRLEGLEKKEVAEKAAVTALFEEWTAKKDEYAAGCVGWRQTPDCDPLRPRQKSNDGDCLKFIHSGQSGYCVCGELREGAPSPQERGRGHGEEDAGEFDDLDMDMDDDEDNDHHKADDSDGTVMSRVLHNFTCDHADLQCGYVCRHGGTAGTYGPAPRSPKHFTLAEADALRTLKVETERKHADAVARLAGNKERVVAGPGVGELLRTLEGESFTFDHKEFTYTLRPFVGIYQSDLGNAAQPEEGMTIGLWSGFANTTYASWSKDKFDYAQMLFANGDRCYNGIVRSAEVQAVCGPHHLLAHVEEPSMCRYRLVFETPAMCDEQRLA